MHSKEPIIRELLSVKDQLIDKAVSALESGRHHDKVDAENRRRYVTRLIRELEAHVDGRVFPKSVFVSFSEKSGRIYYEQVAARLRNEHEFDVKTGFEAVQGDDANVLKRVLTALRSVSLFVGILTKEYQIMQGDRTTWAPSVWTLEEKGMALALGLPLVLLVQEGVDDDYWKKTVPMDVHFIFSDADFDSKAEAAVAQLTEKYSHRLELFLRDGHMGSPDV